MDRVILHCDLNSFFASVELLNHPELRELPVAVCGDPTSRHGIILAKNEPAKRFGVQTAETVWQAKKKCPALVFLPPHHGLYREYSQKVNAIYGQYTDLVEPFGIDESWLDITGSMHLFGGDPVSIASQLRDRMRREPHADRIQPACRHRGDPLRARQNDRQRPRPEFLRELLRQRRDLSDKRRPVRDIRNMYDQRIIRRSALCRKYLAHGIGISRIAGKPVDRFRRHPDRFAPADQRSGFFDFIFL